MRDSLKPNFEARTIPKTSLYKWPLKAKWALCKSVYSQLIRNTPGTICVEVSTHCNRRCPYCPQSVKPSKPEVISGRLWLTVLNRLRELNSRSFIFLNLFNELALVPRSWTFVEDVVDLGYSPRLYTNGDFPEAIRKWLDAGAVQILVTEHQPYKPGWTEALGDLPDRPEVTVRRLEPGDLDHRAGWVDVLYPALKTCVAPDVFNIRIDGTVSICCLDYARETDLGDIAKSSIMEIWNGHRYRQARDLVRNGKPATKLCENCFNPKPTVAKNATVQTD